MSQHLNCGCLKLIVCVCLIVSEIEPTLREGLQKLAKRTSTLLLSPMILISKSLRAMQRKWR